MFKNYFKTAFRNLSRNKIYSFINIIGLSLGLASAMLIILYVKDERSYDRFHQNVSNIFRVVNQEIKEDKSKGRKDSNSGPFQGPKFTAKIPEIKSFVRVKAGYENIKNGTEIKGQEMLYVDSNFFSMFTFPLLRGNPHTALLIPESVVISEDMAKRQFGTTNAIGKTILLIEDGKQVPHGVTAVTKRCPQNSSIKFEMLRPIKMSKEEESSNENWFNFYLNTFVVLAPNADVNIVEAKMKKIYESD